MKIAIVGCGAMGSVYAGLLAAAGNEVWAVDIDAKHIAAIESGGLHVSGASGERTVRLNATTEPTRPGRCDLVVIATKAMHAEQAARDATAMIGPDTLVLTIQNGMGSSDRVASALPGAHVAIGVAGGFGASLDSPGHVHHNGWELLRLGERDGAVTPRLQQISEVWAAAGFRVRCYDDATAMIWEKFICNVCFSGTCALTRLTIGEVIRTDDAWEVALGCAREAFEVARAKSVALPFTGVEAHVRAFGGTIPNARPSMLLDHLARQKAELDFINGAVPPLARQYGLQAPVNATVTALLKAQESQF